MSKIKAIIPAAGFGTRVGMKPNQSKEMLIWDQEPGQRVIDYSLNLCKEADLEPLIISRAEKTDLNEYLRSKGIEPVIIEPKGEWMDSILAVEEHWGEYNILILPDTRWNKPLDTLEQIDFQFEHGCSISIGLHVVNDSSKWCIYKGCELVEKPLSKVEGFAFGVLGFDCFRGSEVFRGLSSDKQTYLGKNHRIVFMENFIDITRGDYSLTIE